MVAKPKYLGELSVNKCDSPFAEWTPYDFALDFIRRYGGIDGERHKTWVLDQVARILNGAPVAIRMARWGDGNSEYRLTVGTSEAYEAYAVAYDLDVGIAP